MIDWQSVGLELEAIILARIYRYHRGVSEFSSMISDSRERITFSCWKKKLWIQEHGGVERDDENLNSSYSPLVSNTLSE
ncbi:hypothetical protein P8452_51143 [Trifolium repens]|nr:hypothetical protein P8452_51143 [Trifolium repens]